MAAKGVDGMFVVELVEGMPKKQEARSKNESIPQCRVLGVASS